MQPPTEGNLNLTYPFWWPEASTGNTIPVSVDPAGLLSISTQPPLQVSGRRLTLAVADHFEVKDGTTLSVVVKKPLAHSDNGITVQTHPQHFNLTGSDTDTLSLRLKRPLRAQDDGIDVVAKKPLTVDDDGVGLKSDTAQFALSGDQGDTLTLRLKTPLRTESDGVNLVTKKPLVVDGDGVGLKTDAGQFSLTGAQSDTLTLRLKTPLRTESDGVNLVTKKPLVVDGDGVGLKTEAGHFALSGDQGDTLALRLKAPLRSQGDGVDLVTKRPLLVEGEAVALKTDTNHFTVGGDQSDTLTLRLKLPMRAQSDGIDVATKKPISVDQDGLTLKTDPKQFNLAGDQTDTLTLRLKAPLRVQDDGIDLELDEESMEIVEGRLRAKPSLPYPCPYAIFYLRADFLRATGPPELGDSALFWTGYTWLYMTSFGGMVCGVINMRVNRSDFVPHATYDTRTNGINYTIVINPEWNQNRTNLSGMPPPTVYPPGQEISFDPDPRTNMYSSLMPIPALQIPQPSFYKPIYSHCFSTKTFYPTGREGVTLGEGVVGFTPGRVFPDQNYRRVLVFTFNIRQTGGDNWFSGTGTDHFITGPITFCYQAANPYPPHPEPPPPPPPPYATGDRPAL
ncbi:fiber-1 [Duck adenovirus 4]|uniref:Fiber-1 n=1 Tax=Duck adenovirus 4 TaxID=2726020 RepID=A0A6M3QBX1_9ADEN|nr:fiber-1 [Duck adenovirus 4]